MFRNVVAIVSGGASGLGAATVSYFVKNGARGVVVADLPSSRGGYIRMVRALEEADAVATAARDGPGGDNEGGATGVAGVLRFAETDVTDEGQVSAALDMAESEFGEHVNVAVSCAGIAPARKTLSVKTKPDKNGNDEVTRRIHSLSEFETAMRINATGTFNLARLAADRMSRRPPHDAIEGNGDGDDRLDGGEPGRHRRLAGGGSGGCIVNTASIAAFEGQVGQVAYAASKGAVVGMTLPMARELAPLGIRVVTIAPGLFRTPLLDDLPENAIRDLGSFVPHPSRLGDPDEFAQLVGSIVSNPYLNGTVIRLDGALRMPP